MGENRANCVKIINNCDNEEGYFDFNFSISPLNLCEKNSLGIFNDNTILLNELTYDDNDEEFWAEDELSNSESHTIIISKCKIKHSVSQRNRIYRNKSKLLNYTSSSCSYISKVKLPLVKRRRKRHHDNEDKYRNPTAILTYLNNNTWRNVLKKNYYMKIRLLKNRKK